MWGVDRRAARGEAGAGRNKADGARSDVTGFRKMGRGAYDDCAGCAKAAGHIQVIKTSYMQDDSIKRSATLK